MTLATGKNPLTSDELQKLSIYLGRIYFSRHHRFGRDDEDRILVAVARLNRWVREQQEEVGE